MAWNLLATDTLTGTSTTMSTGTFAAKKNLKVEIYTINTGGVVNAKMQFNSDTGSNYSYRYNADGGSNTTANSQTEIDLRMGELNGPAYSSTVIFNLSGQEKLSMTDVVNANTSGPGSYPSWYVISGIWSNTSAQITSINLLKSAAGSFASGSYITVYGTD